MVMQAQLGDVRSLREELARVVDGRSPIGFVRDDIVRSWRHSVAMGLRPGCLEPPVEGEIDRQSAMLRAARAVVDRLANDLTTTSISVVVTDERVRVVDHRVPDAREQRRLDDAQLAPGVAWRTETIGTTALGLASEARMPVLVDGLEHFMDALTGLTTASAPVKDPRTGQLLGAVSLVCAAHAANVLQLPVARHTACHMEQRLLDGSSAQERLLNEHFLRARRRTRGPLAVVGDGILLMNGASAHVFSNADQPWLWAVASQALERHELELVPFPRADGTSCVGALQPVRDGNDVIGAIIRFRTMSADGRARTARSDRPIFGWKSLTETEHALAALVAEGLTNKEAAARLFVSRHTIDSHLRQIFRKLDIYSRVELARRVVEREICTDDPRDNRTKGA